MEITQSQIKRGLCCLPYDSIEVKYNNDIRNRYWLSKPYNLCKNKY